MAKTVKGAQLSLIPMGPKKILARLPPGLFEKFTAAMAKESTGAPPFTPRPSTNDILVRLVAEYAEFWLTIAETAEGKVLAKGLKRKGASRG